MSDGEINNGNMDEEFGINMPAPQYAWQDMLTRLDDDMPAATVPLPNSIILVDNGLMRGLTSLLGLLFITGAALLFSGKDVWVKNDKAVSNLPNYSNRPSSINDSSNSADNNATAPLQADSPGNAVNSTGSSTAPGRGRTKAFNNTRHLSVSSHSVVQNTNQLQDISNDKTAVPPVANTPAIVPMDAQNNTHVTKAKQNAVNTPAGDTAKSKSTIDSEDKDKADTTVWQAGIWFKAQLPFSGAQHYFAGPNASSQPWRIILPGVWISAQTGKHLFEAEVNPFAQTVYNPKPFAVNTVLVNGQTPATETKRLNKAFGVSVSAGYSYNIGGSWWLGGRLQATILTKGAGTIAVANDSAVISNRFTTFTKDSAGLQGFQPRLDVEALYKAKRWQAGARAGVYFSSSPIKYSNAKNPLETEIFFRWQLWEKKK